MKTRLTLEGKNASLQGERLHFSMGDGGQGDPEIGFNGLTMRRKRFYENLSSKFNCFGGFARLFKKNDRSHQAGGSSGHRSGLARHGKG